MIRPLDGRNARERGSVSSVEALVLVVMMAILIAIAIPSYIAMQNRGHDSTARGNVRDGVEAVEAYRADRNTYAGANAATLARYVEGLEPSSYKVTATADAYCVQSTVSGRSWHQSGPGGELSRGRCR